MINKKINSLRRARNMAIFFFVVSIVATVCVLGVSFLDGPSSAKISDFIKSIFQTVKPDVDIDHGDCSGLELSLSQSRGYVGDVSLANVSPVPAQSNLLPYVITVDDPNVAVVEDGKIRYVGRGETNVSVSLVNNPSVSYTVDIRCNGFNPKDIVDINCDDMFGAGNTIEARSVETPNITATIDGLNYESINWYHELKVTVTDLDGSPTRLAELNDERLLTYKKGQVLVTLQYGPDYSMSEQVVVNIVDSGVNPMPTTLVLKSESIQVNLSEEWRSSKFVKKVLDEKGNDITNEYKDSFLIESADNSVVWVNEQQNGFRGVELGTTTLTFSCVFNDDLVLTVPVTVVLSEPQSVHIVGNEHLYIYGDNKYNLVTDSGETIPNNDITWTVVKGNATVSKGVVSVDGLGKVTIEASITTSQGTLTATKQLRVRFYENFPQFVRKIAGHFAAFFVLGACAMAASLLCTRYKKLALPVAVVYGFLVAFLSEIFQLPIFTAGRSYSFMDVILDTLGVASGCVTMLVLFGINLLLIRLVGKNRFRALVFALKHISIGKCSKRKFNKLVYNTFDKQLAIQERVRKARKQQVINSNRKITK
ncbi:MAG: VanZ family protein [Clostridia bacterium]|nr:VanZ family protein [Clostridia bacterium]